MTYNIGIHDMKEVQMQIAEEYELHSKLLFVSAYISIHERLYYYA